MQHFFMLLKQAKHTVRQAHRNTGYSVRNIVLCILLSVATEYLMHGQSSFFHSLNMNQWSWKLCCWISDKIKMQRMQLSSNALCNNYEPVCTEVQTIKQLL